jgi:aminoglycoside 6'-N-acetyltransferase
VREWWSSLEDPEHTREGLRNDGAAFAIEVDGTLAGWLGYNEETDCDCRYASFDIFVAPEHQDQRVGRAALELATRWLFEERGHHRLTIDPALHNERAIRAYAAADFRPVGVMRAYERGADGHWHDNLLMDLLRDEMRSGAWAGTQATI